MALGEIGRGYAGVAKAFATRDRAKLAGALVVIRTNQRRLISALAALSAIGYESAPVSDRSPWSTAPTRGDGALALG